MLPGPDASGVATFIEKVRATMDECGSMPKTKDTNRFTRIMARVNQYAVRSDSGATLNKLLMLAGEFEIRWKPALKLYAELCGALAVHRLGVDLELASRAPDARKFFQKLVGASNKMRLASEQLLAENRKVGDRVAYTWMENSLWRWARQRHQGVRNKDEREIANDELSAVGMRVSRYGEHLEYTDYGQTGALNMWLKFNVVMAEQIKQLQVYNLASAEGGFANAKVGSSEIVLLLGERLPNLFIKFTGQNYSPSKRDNENVDNERGVKFVGMCLDLMGLEPRSPNTIGGYYWTARTRRSHAG